jgi:hypothetical protein
MKPRIWKLISWSFIATSKGSVLFWLALSLAFAILYGVLGLQDALDDPYMVQDDARQHVFWMRRFLDPDLFPNDLIANYFQSVAPAGYTAFYRIPAWFGVDPLFVNKLLPTILAVITTIYSFGACLQILPVPVAGFVATLLLNQNLWMRDDLVSATPAAFVYPFFAAFLYYWLKRSLLGSSLAIAWLGSCYPQCVLIACGVLILGLFDWKKWRIELLRDRATSRIAIVGLVVAFVVLLPYAVRSSDFGDIITASTAKTLFDFSENGWSSFFFDNPFEFWLCGKRSGVFPAEWCYLGYEGISSDADWYRYFPLKLPQTWFALAFPLLLAFSKPFPLVRRVNRNVVILGQVLLVSIALFFLSHAVLFKLHLPNRYTEHSFRIVAAIAAGFAIIILLDAIVRAWSRWLAVGLSVLVAITLIGYPDTLKLNDSDFPFTGYKTGRFPQLYEFLQQQPKDIVIASLDKEINNLPTFAKRSIFVGADGYTLPYHRDYYREVYQRTIALMEAQYSSDRDRVRQFIETSEIDFWILDTDAFTAKYIWQNDWLDQYPKIRDKIAKQFQSDMIPVLPQWRDRCTVLTEKDLVVLQTSCILTVRP